MKKLNVLFWGLLLLVSACESITVIQSTPNGARVYINGMHVGETPYTYTDDKIIFSKTSLRVEKEGYETASLILVRNESAEMGPIVGGFFTGGLTWPGENTNAQGVNRDINGCKEIWKFFSQYDININVLCY